MTAPPSDRPPRYKTWAAWVLVVLLLPFSLASLGMLYALYLALTTGSLSTVAKGYRATTTTLSFADSPVWFCVFVLLNCALAAVMIVMTIVLARLAFGHLRRRDANRT
ncbi:MAG: hypothetical protein AB7I01_10680 [Gammaproteobacteria bacterium]